MLVDWLSRSSSPLLDRVVWVCGREAHVLVTMQFLQQPVPLQRSAVYADVPVVSARGASSYTPPLARSC
eukprot:s16_g14.t1